jgi:hypothetical protein
MLSDVHGNFTHGWLPPGWDGRAHEPRPRAGALRGRRFDLRVYRIS